MVVTKLRGFAEGDNRVLIFSGRQELLTLPELSLKLRSGPIVG
jgi:hypothetical protein